MKFGAELTLTTQVCFNDQIAQNRTNRSDLPYILGVVLYVVQLYGSLSLWRLVQVRWLFVMGGGCGMVCDAVVQLWHGCIVDHFILVFNRGNRVLNLECDGEDRKESRVRLMLSCKGLFCCVWPFLAVFDCFCLALVLLFLVLFSFFFFCYCHSTSHQHTRTHTSDHRQRGLTYLPPECCTTHTLVLLLELTYPAEESRQFSCLIWCDTCFFVERDERKMSSWLLLVRRCSVVYDRGFMIARAIEFTLLSTGFPANDLCTIRLSRSVPEHPYVFKRKEHFVWLLCLVLPTNHCGRFFEKQRI